MPENKGNCKFKESLKSVNIRLIYNGKTDHDKGSRDNCRFTSYAASYVHKCQLGSDPKTCGSWP